MAAAERLRLPMQSCAENVCVVALYRSRALGCLIPCTNMYSNTLGGSTLEAMALAVERASVVLVALSQGYKDSSSCRTG